MNKFRPHIIPEYPKNNIIIFEEWFAERYNYFLSDYLITKNDTLTDRRLMPFFPTSYWVNNNYAQDEQAKKEAQEYIDNLPRDKKYFGICQYDDGFLIDWKGLDMLEFNMSKKISIELPLLCMPHPYLFSSPKKYIGNFVGSNTHKIRESAYLLMKNKDYYISFLPHDISDYCRILHESIFTLAFRGYGANSFRLVEAMQYNSIPVYISDEFILPFNMTESEFNTFGVLIKSEDADKIEEILKNISPNEIISKQEKCKEAYEEYYTYEGCFNQIIKELEAEYNNRQS